MPDPAPLCKLVRFADFPEVVTLAPLGQLKARLRAEGDHPSADIEAALRALLELYFIDQPSNRRAWEAIITSMARAEGPGRGFLISGAYGSGKSHLLAALSLLAEHPQAWGPFTASHPWMRRFARAFGPGRRLLALEIPLDHYRGSAHALESIVFGRIEEELHQRLGDAAPALTEETAYLEAFARLVLPQRSEPFRRFLVEVGEDREWDDLARADPPAARRLAHRFLRREGVDLSLERSRADTWARVRQGLGEARFTGLVLLVDELSLFLASKDRRGLDEDASFLQFLGQQAAGHPLPCWVVAATQRALEDVGDIDSHSLRQIRDRYESHHLSLAQLRAVIERKLVTKPDPRAFLQALRRACEAWSPEGMTFPAEEVARTYPFNPLALEAFQGAAESFLSQTRSVIQAVNHARRTGLLAQGPLRLISADLAFDLVAERLGGRSELARFEAARRFYADNARRICPAQPDLVQAAFKALALAALGNVRWTARETADALAGSPVRDDGAPGFRERLREALRAMRRRGAYIECVPHEGDLADQYYLELTSDTAEAMRRRLFEVMEALGSDDSRVFEHALAACEGDAFPLALLAQPRPQQFEWMNTVRQVTVERRDLRRLRPEEPSRLADALASPVTAECGYLVMGDLRDPDGQRQAWLEAAGQVAGRWAGALVAWLPRALAEDETELLREHAALRMLAADPTLREGEHGREVAARVSQRLALQGPEAARAVAAAYMEGELLRADGRRSEPARMAAGDRWEDIIAGVFDFPLRELFPRFRQVAPRKRLAGKQRSTFVIESFLRPGAASPPPDSALEEALSAYLEPLGLARREDGEWRIAADSEAAAAALELVPARGSGAALDASSVVRFADCGAAVQKGQWGLTPEMVELVAGTLVRAGRLEALDGFLKPVPFARLGTPLSDHIAYLARPAPLPAAVEQRVLALAAAVLEDCPARLDLASRTDLWERLGAWAQTAPALTAELTERLTTLYQSLGQGPAEWTESRQALAVAEQLAGAIQPDADAAEGLTALAECGAEAPSAGAPGQGRGGDWTESLAAFRPLADFLRRHAALAALMGRYLTDERLRVQDPGLSALREGLLDLLGQGEAIIPRAAEFRSRAEAFVAYYAARYQRHHGEMHSVGRFRPYSDLRRGPEFRALTALAPLAERDAVAAVEVQLRGQMERHCAGGRLAEALRRQPVCPECGLALGEEIELAPPQALVEQARDALRGALSQLAEQRERVAASLQAEPDARKAQAVSRALGLAADASADEVLKAFTPPVVEWLQLALRGPQGARLRLGELGAFLRGKRLTRRDALRAFGDWLAAHGAAGDDAPVEFE